MRRPLLFVGMAPGRNTNPERPMEGDSGRRLARIFGYKHVHEFADAVNVLEKYPGGRRGPRRGDRFPLRRARKRAGCVSSVFSKYKVVVVLGRGPSRVFDLEWFRWTEIFGAKVTAMPHPSGANKWFNYSENKRKLSRFKGRVENLCRKLV